jgi:hypothetical protein
MRERTVTYIDRESPTMQTYAPDVQTLSMGLLLARVVIALRRPPASTART